LKKRRDSKYTDLSSAPPGPVGSPEDTAAVSKSRGRTQIASSCLKKLRQKTHREQDTGKKRERRVHSPLSPLPMQSMPRRVFPSATCRLRTSANVSIGGSPEFSASASGTESSADANARMAYCSIEGIYTCNRTARDIRIVK
jgi:hypothetical protein